MEPGDQDGAQFEDALRRLHALEVQLAGRVQEDITALRQQWVQQRVDRVTNNTYKLYQVRENLKLSKLLYVEEEQLLGEFGNVKAALLGSPGMDDEMFEATRETCVVLGGKLTDVRTRQLLCYSASRDLESAINKEIMAVKIEERDLASLDLQQVRCNTPLRELSPTPLDRHRSREPSPFRMPAIKLSAGTAAPGNPVTADPHAYFSRPGSSQSVHGGRDGSRGGRLDGDTFRAAMEAKQAEDDSPPQRRPAPALARSASGMQIRAATGEVLGGGAGEAGTFSDSERPGSAMSECSLDLAPPSRPASRGPLGDAVSGVFDPWDGGNTVNVPDEEVMKELVEERAKYDLENEQRIAQERKKAALEEQRLVDEKRIVEKRKLDEETRLAKERKIAEEKHLAEKRLRLEEEKILAEEKRKAEEKEKAEKKKELEEMKIEEEKRKAEEKKLVEEKMKEEAKKKLEEKKLADLQKKEEAKRKAEEKKLSEIQKKEEAKKKG